MREKSSNVYISYSKGDGEAFVKRLRNKLFQDEIGKQLKYWKAPSWMVDESDWNIIHTAINETECLVVVLTPCLLESDFLPKLFQYKNYGESCICFVHGTPEMEITSQLLPTEAKHFHIYNIDTEWDSFVEEIFQHCHTGKLLNMAPALPTDYVHRPHVYEQIKQMLYLPNEQEGVPLYISIAGPEGFGKTTIATALCHDREIQEHFHEGILWMDLNDKGKELEQITKVYNTISGNSWVFYNLGEATHALNKKLYQLHSNYLLVVDNVQRLHQFSLFVGPGNTPLKILSTGQGSVEVNATGNDGWQKRPAIIQVMEMEDEEASLLLTKDWELNEAGVEVARNILKETSKCPLLIKLMRCAAMAQANDNTSFQQALTSLLEAGKKMKVQYATEGRKDTATCFIDAVFSLLPVELRQRCIQLGALRRSTQVSSSTIYGIWDVEAPEGVKLLKKLAAYALLNYNEAKDEVSIHKMLFDYFTGVWRNSGALRVQQLHRLTADAYQLTDAYDWQFHISYLLEAGKRDKAIGLLSDYHWLKAKLANTDVYSLLNDFALIKNRPKLLELLYNAFNMSYIVLALEKRNLPVQLSQRLRFHLEELPSPFKYALEEDLLNGPCKPIRTAMHPVGNAVYSKNLESCITRLIVWGDKIILGLSNGRIKIKHMHSGETFYTLAGHTNYIEDLAVTGSTLVSSSWDKTVRTWNLQTGKATHQFTDQPGPARKLGVYRGVFVCSAAAYDNEKERWVSTLKGRDVVTGRELYSFLGKADYIPGFATSGNVVVYCDTDNSLISRDLTTGKVLHHFAGQTGNISCLEIAEGIVIGANKAYQDHSIRTWDLETGQELHVFEGHQGKITCMAVSGNTLISGSEDGTVRCWSITEGYALHVYKGHTKDITGVAINGDVIVSSSSDGTLRSWSLSSGKPQFVFYGHSAEVTAFVMFGNKMISGSNDCTMKCWDLVLSGQEYKSFGHFNTVECLTMAGDTLVTGSADGTLKRWELTTGQLLQAYEGHLDQVTSVTIAGNILVSSGSKGSLKSWDVTTGKALHLYEGHTDTISGTATSGRVLLSASWDKTIRSWNLESGKMLHEFKGHTGRIFCVAVAGGVVVSGGDDETLRSWELATGKELNMFMWPNHAVDYVAVSGEIVVSGENSPSHETLKSWNLSTGEAAQEFTATLYDGHPRGTTCVAVSGDILVSAGRGFDKHIKSKGQYSNTVISWDLPTGKMLHKFEGHSNQINSLQIAGEICISGSNDETIKIWNLKDGSGIATIYTNEAITKLHIDPSRNILIAGGSRGGLYFYQLNIHHFPGTASRNLLN